MRHLVTLAFLVLALLLYARGFAVPGHLFIVLGVLAESVFWWRILQWRRARSHDASN
jgi:hypothetical protein